MHNSSSSRRALWWRLFVASALLLPPFPLELGNAGPHICLVFAAAGLVIGAAQSRDWRRSADSVSLWLALFTAWLAFSVLFAAYYSGAGLAAASLARVGLFGIGVYVYFFFRLGPGRDVIGDPLKWAIAGFALAVLAALWACIDFYFQFLPSGRFAQQFIWLPDAVYRRAQGVFREAGPLGSLCSLALTGVAVSVVQPEIRRKLRLTYLLPGAFVLILALLLSFSRASAANLAAGLAALFFLERKRIRWTSFLAATAAALIVTAAAIALWAPDSLALYGRRVSDTFVYGLSHPDEVLSGRVVAWGKLVSGLTSHPWVLVTGIGYKTLPYSSYFGEPMVADNMYLSLVAETGIPGLLLFLGLSAAMLASCLRLRRRADAQSRFLASWFFCLWIGQLIHMLAADALTYWRVLPLAFFVLAAAEQQERGDQ